MIDVPGMSGAELALTNALLGQLGAKRHRNAMRAAYYDGRNAIEDFGVSIPPAFRNVAVVLGWPAKAVDILNRRCVFEQFHSSGVDLASSGVEQAFADNRMARELPQVGVSSLVHSVAWLITTRGDVEAGEPKALITARDALTGTGEWDFRRRRLSSFLSVMATRDGEPSQVALHIPGQVITATRGRSGWSSERQRTGSDRVMVHPYVYRPNLGRPFGASRISRAVMSLTNSALRTVVRSEVSAEFYSSPQRYLLGADKQAFTDASGNVQNQWQAILGRVWAVQKDEDGDTPTVGQFPQSSQQPHMDQLKAWAQLFAGETSIPISSLGISSDANPTSAEAYLASREDLITEAEGTTDGWGVALEGVAADVAEVMNDGPVDMSGVTAAWRDVRFTSRAAAADAGAKIAAVVPGLADTEVGLELLGLSPDQIRRFLAERRVAAGRGVLEGLRAQVAAPDVVAAQ